MRACVGRGFTLVEVLVALAVLAIALTAALVALGSITRNSVRIYDVTLSRWAAQDAAARIRLDPDDAARKLKTDVTTMLYGRQYQVGTIFLPDDRDSPHGAGEFRITVALPGAPPGAILNESNVRVDVGS